MRDLSIMVDTKFNDANQIEDFERYFGDLFNKSVQLENTEDEYVLFSGIVDDKVFDRVLTFVSVSPYGCDYEILEWFDGNSKKIW